MVKRFPIPYSDPRWWWGGKDIPTCFECAFFKGYYDGDIRCEKYVEGIPKFIFNNKLKNESGATKMCEHFIQYKQQ